MSFFVSRITPAPLHDLQNDLTNQHENPSALGKPKFGFTRRGVSLPFYTKNTSWPSRNALSHPIRPLLNTVKPTPPRFKESALGQTEWHTQVSLDNLQQIASKAITPENHLLPFNPLGYIHDAIESKTNAMHDAQWTVFSNLVKTPIGEEFLQKHQHADVLPTHIEDLQTLSQIHHHFETQSKNSRTLNNLINEAKRESNKNSIPHLALLHCIERLSGASAVNPQENKQWANGAFKNGLLEQHEHSEFMQIDARLRKLGKWIERTEQKSNRLSRFIPSIKKNPFRALKFGTMGADRGDINTHTTQYENEWSAALSSLNELNLTLDPNRQGLKKLIHQWHYKSAHRALNMLKEGQTTLKNLRKIRHFLKQNTETHSENNSNSTHFDTVNTHIQQLKNIMGANKTTHYTQPLIENDRTPQKTKILGHLQHVVTHIEGASRWKLLSGGVFGLGTKGITTTFTSLMFGLLARIKVDLRWLRTRLAGVEIAMPAYNLELMLYSSTQTGKQTGIGATVGPSIGVAELTGGGNIKAWSSEHKNNEGVVLRMHRERGKEPRESFKRMLNRLFELSTHNPAPGETLKTLLQEFPELSTNLIGQSTEYKRQHAASLEGNAGIVAGPVKIGLTGEVGVEYQALVQKDHVDKTGFLKVERHIQSKGLRGFAEARFDVRFNAIKDPFRLTPLTLDNLSVSTDFLTMGRQLRQDIVYHQNRISPVSFYEIEYQSFEDFKNAILSNKNAWVSAKGENKVNEFLTQANNKQRSIHTFAARWELKKETVRLVNHYNSAIMLLAHSTDLEEQNKVRTFQQIVQRLLNDPQSYAPTSFRTYERQDATETMGLHIAARLEAVNQAEGVYAHSRMM